MNQPLSEDVVRRAAAALLRRAKEARDDPVKFYEFVVREEATRKRLYVAPHQRVIFKFLEAHPKCVLRLPPGFGKTFVLASETMRDLGRDPTSRNVILSAAQDQAKKPLSMVRDYIEESAELKLVFPLLQRSGRRSDQWTQTKLVVERPRGIRDPSVAAFGFRGKLPGSRIKRVFCDDLLSLENTATEEQRNAVHNWFINTVLPRQNNVRDPRCVVSNTPYHPDDLTYKLEASGWPSLTMTIDGYIYIKNSDLWDCEDIRLSDLHEDGRCRLSAHDNPLYDPAQQHLPPEQRTGYFRDDNDEVYLWPERYGEAEDAELRRQYASQLHQYYLLYHMRVRNDEDGYIRTAWVQQCKANGHQLKLFYPRSTFDGPAYTGVDVGIGTQRKNDKSAIFTFGLLPDGTKEVLRVQTGRWPGLQLIEKIREHHEAYGSQIRVETNAAQDLLRQWALSQDKSLPIKAHNTGSNKHSREFGVESVFLEFENGGWAIPSTPTGEMADGISEWIDAMSFYDPTKHTPDVMIACWLARMQAWNKIKPRRPGGVLPGRTAAGIPGAMSGLLNQR